MAALKYLISLLLIVFGPSLAFAANCVEPGSIVSVSNSAYGGYEYVNFKFKNPSIPSFTTTNVLPPFVEDPSGNPITVAGKHWTQVQFRNVNWLCSIQKSFSLPKPAIKAVKSTEQYEGQVTYVIGRGAASHYISTKIIDLGGYKVVRVKFRP